MAWPDSFISSNKQARSKSHYEMNGYPGEYCHMSLAPLAKVVILACLMVACNEADSITEYSLQKIDPQQHHGHEWLPLKPTTYRIGSTTVTSDSAGILNKYENCTVMSVNNWECPDSDESGSFGFRNGKSWRQHESDTVKYVSSFEYHRVLCEWSSQDKNEGNFWETVSCLIEWLTT